MAAGTLFSCARRPTRMSPIRQIVFAACFCYALFLTAGCSNQSSHFANPFYAPDRVPPPSTRTLAPGSAQPYYSGDPLPPLQSGSQPATAQQVSSTPPISASPLVWNSPTTIGNSVQGPLQPVSGSGMVSLNAPSPNQEVLPVSWSDSHPASIPPRVRLPHSSSDAIVMPPAPGSFPPPSSEGFQPRLRRPASY